MLIYFVWYLIFVFMLHIIVVTYSRPVKEWEIHQEKIVYTSQEMVISIWHPKFHPCGRTNHHCYVITFIFLEAFLCFWWPELHIGCIRSNYLIVFLNFSMVGVFYVKYIQNLNKCLPSVSSILFHIVCFFKLLKFSSS